MIPCRQNLIYSIHDARGNRTDIDVGGTDNTDLTFNLADQLTRVDYEDNSYRVFTYDDNGNCTKEEYYSGTYLVSTVVVPQLSTPPCQGGIKGGLHTGQGGCQTGQGDSDSSPSSNFPSEDTLHSTPPCQGGMSCNAGQGGLLNEHDWNTLSREEQQTLKKQMLEDNERLQATREHYPYTKAPPSLLRSRYLSPYTPEITSEDVFEFRTLQLTNPELAEYMRNLMWNPHTQAPLFKGGYRGVSDSLQMVTNLYLLMVSHIQQQHSLTPTTTTMTYMAMSSR